MTPASKRAVDGLVSFLCNVDVMHLMAAAQATRDKVVAWLQSIGTHVTSHASSTALQVLAALEQAVHQQKPKPAGQHAQGSPKMRSTKTGVRAGPSTAPGAAPEVMGAAERAVAVIDESMLAHMPPEKVRSNTATCHLPACLTVWLAAG